MSTRTLGAADILNIRYGPIRNEFTPGEHGTIRFDFAGREFTIMEPDDVILVGVPKESAQKWIANAYGFLLSPFATVSDTES